MTLPAVTFSDDQAEAFDRIAGALRGVGVDLEEGVLTPPIVLMRKVGKLVSAGTLEAVTGPGVAAIEAAGFVA